MDVAKLLPHAGPMCCIQRLLSSSETAAVAEVTLTPEHCLVTEGKLEKAGCVEMAAQAAGAMQGFDMFLKGLPPQAGYLVGVQDFDFYASAEVGDTLTITVAIETEFGEVTVIFARVLKKGELLAEGRLKVYVPE